jgi:CHAP domain
MIKLDLATLSQPDAVLIQHGLKALGFYDGTTRGTPGSLTQAAYENYLLSLAVVAKPAVASSLAARLVDVLSSENGVREIPSNSNRGKRVEEYQRATWLGDTGWAWCAAFICWGIKQIDDVTPLPFPRPRTAGAWDFERWAREDAAGGGVKLFKPVKSANPIKAGDIVIFTFSHIGLAIEDEKDGKVKTVEGNTSPSGSREGGGVYIQYRKTSLVRSHIRLFA